MATWITHLRIAENLLLQIPGLADAEFVVGNIAPDSGIPDERWEKFTPPAEVTHFQAPNGARYQLADLDFYQQHLFPLAESKVDDQKRFSFLLGYFCHLVTDNLWNELIGQPTYQRFKAQFDVDPSFIWEVKKDWYGLDFEYVRDHPESLYWRVFLHCNYPFNYLDFLMPEGVRQRIEYIQTYYQRRDEHALERINHPRIYLTMPEIDTFVETATSRFQTIFLELKNAKMNQNIKKYTSTLEFV